MNKPAVTESPPITRPPKRLVLTKLDGGKWTLELSGPIKRADINHLRRFLQIEYIRTKRKQRMAAAAIKRKEPKNATV